MKKRASQVQICLRVPSAWLKEADELASKMVVHRGMVLTRTSVLRCAIAEGLAALAREAEAKR